MMKIYESRGNMNFRGSYTLSPKTESKYFIN